MLKKHVSFLISSRAAALYFPLCLKHSLRLFKALPLETKPALIGHLKHTFANTVNNNRAAVPNQFLQAKSCKCRTHWRSVMSQSHGIKGRATDEAF